MSDSLRLLIDREMRLHITGIANIIRIIFTMKAPAAALIFLAKVVGIFSALFYKIFRLLFLFFFAGNGIETQQSEFDLRMTGNSGFLSIFDSEFFNN